MSCLLHSVAAAMEALAFAQASARDEFAIAWLPAQDVAPESWKKQTECMIPETLFGRNTVTHTTVQWCA